MTQSQYFPVLRWMEAHYPKMAERLVTDQRGGCTVVDGAIGFESEQGFEAYPLPAGYRAIFVPGPLDEVFLAEAYYLVPEAEADAFAAKVERIFKLKHQLEQALTTLSSSLRMRFDPLEGVSVD